MLAEIEQLVRQGMPTRVGVGVRQVGRADVAALHPVEEQYLGPRATDRRRVMFTLGRAAARAALVDLGFSTGTRDGAGAARGVLPIGRGPGGEPLWPEGIVGAISHSGDLAVSVVGWAVEYAGIGVDVEQRSPGMSPRAARLVCRPSEYEWAAEDAGPTRRTLLFSAKEAIFKALYPIEGVWLGFGDAELRWDAARCVFDAEVLKAAGAAFPAGTRLEVRCGVTAAAVVSATFARRPPSS